MKILVIGASKGIGRATVREALARGHGVRAFSRGAETALEPAEGLERRAGDARDPGDVAAALEGMDAVVMALGIRERLAMLWEEETLFSEATQVLLPAMQATGPRRLVVVTGFGTGDSRQAMSLPERIGHRAVLGKPYADKDRQEALVRDSALDWTLVRPVILTNGARSGRYRVLSDPKSWRNGLISRADVAHFILDELEAPAHVRDAVVLAR